MPSSLHEVLVELFRERPELALELIDVDGGVPTYDELQFDDPTFNPIAPAEYRADAVPSVPTSLRQSAGCIY